MKNLFVILLLAMGIKSLAQTNIYHPFPASAARWNFDLINGFGACHYKYSIEVAGDTLINATNYKQLITHGFVEILTAPFCSQTMPSYLGAVRNDTANKMVYFVPAFQNIEKVLYDFNLQVGDTIIGLLNPSSSNHVVYEKDSVLVNGSYRNRLKVDSCYNISIIEGIGSDYGLIEIIPGCVTDWGYYNLLCFKENNLVQYPENVFSCALIDGLSNVSTLSNKFNIAPNPSHDYFKITSSNKKMIELKVTDINGKLIKKEVLNNDLNAEIWGLNNGFYFIEIKDMNNQIYRDKLIKID